MHSPDTVEEIKVLRDAIEKLTRSLSKHVVNMTAVEPISDRLEALPNAEQLYRRIVEDYQSPKYDYKTPLRAITVLLCCGITNVALGGEAPCWPCDLDVWARASR